MLKRMTKLLESDILKKYNFHPVLKSNKVFLDGVVGDKEVEYCLSGGQLFRQIMHRYHEENSKVIEKSKFGHIDKEAYNFFQNMVHNMQDSNSYDLESETDAVDISGDSTDANCY